MIFLYGWKTVGVEIISVPLLVHEESHPVSPWFALRVCVADEASEWCGFIGYGVSGEGTQVIAAGVRMCGKYTG